MNWSSGKDAAMALHALLQNPNLECRTLLTSISQEFQRVSMHGLYTDWDGTSTFFVCDHQNCCYR